MENIFFTTFMSDCICMFDTLSGKGAKYIEIGNRGRENGWIYRLFSSMRLIDKKAVHVTSCMKCVEYFLSECGSLR